MTIGKAASLLTIASLVLSGGIVVAALAGDLRWLPISEYKQEKLYDLQDEALDLESKEKYEGGLTQREADYLSRLLQRIERLEQELE